VGIPLRSARGSSAGKVAVLAALLLPAWVVSASGSASAGRANGAGSLPRPVVEEPADRTNCTVVYATDGSTALDGNNEDGRNPLTKIWFVPGEDGSYGSMFVGYDDLVIQGGMNQAGLFFDGLAVREVDVPAKPGKPTYTGQSVLADVLSECDSVPCVLGRFDGVSMPGNWNGQYLFGDRFGDSAIIEPLTVTLMSDRFQVATNFFQSEIPPTERTDSRYLTATRMFASADAVSADLIRDVLDATHQEGTAETVYSTVYELQSKVVHVFYFHEFAADVTLDLGAELAKGVHGYNMSDLFGSNQAAADYAAPIREQVSAAIGRLPAVPVAHEDVAKLAGVYEAPFLTLIVEADQDSLMARQPWTPWVRLVPLSPTEFARVFSTGEGAVHEQRLRFGAEVSSELAQVQIVDDQGGNIVATRAPLPGTRAGGAQAIIALMMIAGAAVAGWILSRAGRARRMRSEPAATATSRHMPGEHPEPPTARARHG
jgi:hypothetical protein